MTRTVRVIPAILTDNATTLGKLIQQTAAFADYAQLDFMDGHFVPSRSFSPADLASVKITFKWEAHLMVLQPEEHLEILKLAGASKVIFHVEAVASPAKEISLIKEQGMKVGLAVNPETPIAKFSEYVPDVDSVLFMAVYPGFYGAKYIPEVLDKVKEFRKTYFKTIVGLDGGVKESNIEEIARAGVDEICVGSAIFLALDPAATYRRLTSLAQSVQ